MHKIIENHTFRSQRYRKEEINVMTLRINPGFCDFWEVMVMKGASIKISQTNKPTCYYDYKGKSLSLTLALTSFTDQREASRRDDLPNAE